MIPTVIDPAAQKIRELLSPLDETIRLGGEALLNLSNLVRTKLPPPSELLEGAEAAEYLRALISMTEEEIVRKHDAYGFIRWLWYLRRTPNELFEGDVSTTGAYDRTLAEVLMSRCTSSRDVSLYEEKVAFKVDEAVLRHLARLIGRVKYLSQLHVLYRLVGKGARLDTRTSILAEKLDEKTWQAIDIYDERHERGEHYSRGGLGLATIDPGAGHVLLKADGSAPKAMLIMRCTPLSLPVPAPVAGRIGFVKTTANYVLEELSLEFVLHPMGEGSDTPEYLPRIAALIQLLMILPAAYEAAPWGLKSTVENGIFYLGRQRLRAIVESQLPVINASLETQRPEFNWASNFDEWIDSLETIRARAWPLIPGSFLVSQNQFVMIDVAGASQTLLHRLEVNRSPLLGNLRASQFELQCQRLVDKTAWAPSAKIAELRGRPLRVDGAHLTDVDAIGQSGDTLLIISCKSVVYDADYDRGDFKVIRNTKATIDDAVAQWSSVIKAIKVSPTGDNFDFSMFKRVLGVVCTPFVVYSDKPESLELVEDELRACASIFELAKWLGLPMEQSP